MEDILIEFQIYLNDKKLITNHDWDFEKMARKFIKGRKIVSKNFIKPAVISSLPCDHLWRWYPDRPDDEKCQRCGNVRSWTQTD